MNAVAPSPASRTSQMCCSLSGSSYSFIPDGGCPSFSRSRINARAFASDSSFVSPPNSTRSQPRPSGSIERSCWWMPSSVMSSISVPSIPSIEIGSCSRAIVTWSAVRNLSG